MTTKAEKLRQARRKREAARKLSSMAPDVPVDIASQSTVHRDAPYFRDDPPTTPSYLAKLDKPFRLAPDSLDELLNCSPEDIGSIDLARMNLLCAVGLPGSDDLDVDAYLSRLDTWAAHILALVDQHFHVFKANPDRYENSEPFWRVSGMVRTLERDFGVHYNPDRIDGQPDWADSQDMLILGLLGLRRTGTCSSIPVLLVALGRRLGYPMKLVRARAHLFSRWDNADGKHPGCANMTFEGASGARGRFNIEFHGQGLGSHSDGYYYQWPMPMGAIHIQRHQRNDPKAEFLVSLTPAQELAQALGCRATVQMATGLHTRAYQTYMQAKRYDPIFQGYAEFARQSLRMRAAELIQARGLNIEACRAWVQDDLNGHLLHKLSTSGNGPAMHAHTRVAIRHRNHIEARFGPKPANFGRMMHELLQLTVAGTDARPGIDLLQPIPAEPERTADAPSHDPDAPFQSIQAIPEPAAPSA